MKRFLLLLPLLCSILPAHANLFDGAKIGGRILDKEKKPVEFAIVTLLKGSDSSLVKGGLTDVDGNFSFDNLNAENYLLSVSFTGYAKVMAGPYTISEGQNFSVGDMVLVPLADMKEVTVTAAQTLFTQKPDMLVMNVENSPVRINGTAWDLIGKSPGVFVDQNNNISLRGKSGVLIYVDGKNTFLAGDQLVSYLQNISASDVLQVEIIPNPPAKYDAEGSGGIINIVTKKGSQLGFNAAVRAGYGQGFYPKYEGGLNFNYATAKYNIYGKYDVSHRLGLERITVNRNIPYNNINTNYNQSTVIHDNPFGNSARLGIDFYAKHNITWGARVDGNLSTEKNHTDNLTNISTDVTDTIQSLDQKNEDHNLFDNISANIYFKQELDTNGGEWSASADYLNYHMDNLTDFNLNYTNNFGAVSAPTEISKSESVSDILIYVGQVDFAHAMGKNYKVETGVKSSYVQTSNDLMFNKLNNQVWQNDTTKSNAFIYKETINAAYGNGYATLGKWQFEGGLRAEQTISDGNSPTTGEHLSKSYIQLFPSVFVLDKLNEKNSLNFTYARRINRPSYEDLNPFVFYLDKYTSQTGNPYLQPEIANSVDVTYSFMDALFVTAGYAITKNGMTDVTKQIDSTGVGYKTTVNLQKVENDYFGISCPAPLGKFLFLENDFNLMYNRWTSELYGSQVDNKNMSWTISSNATVSLPHSMKFQLWGWYDSPGVYGLFQMKSKSGVGCGFSEMFFNKQLQVNLSLQDIFRKNGMRASINFQNQDVYLQFIPEAPRVQLRVRYIIGNTKATRKATSKSGADELKDRTGK